MSVLASPPTSPARIAIPRVAAAMIGVAVIVARSSPRLAHEGERLPWVWETM
jgi:hypothetical protein